MTQFNLLPCKTEDSMEEQLYKIACEVQELDEAIRIYRSDCTDKNRAAILFELLDVVTACSSFANKEYVDDDIDAGCIYTNSKNFVRGYLANDADYYNLSLKLKAGIKHG